MELNGRQRAQFQQALLSAFPSKAKLQQMVSFELDWELDAVAGGQNQADIIFNLINHAKANGSLEALLAAAQTTNPGNPALRDFAQQIANPALPQNPKQPPAGQPSVNSQINAGGVNFQNSISGGQVIQGQTININNSSQPSPPQPAMPQVATPPAADSPPSVNSPITAFVSYSHKDEALREELDDHLAGLRRQGKIADWNDRAIDPGTQWADEINQNLETAQIILLLISAKFMASDFCYSKELARAMERHEVGSARVIPIILKPTDWTSAPFSKLQVLPKDGKPITAWDDPDEAFVNVVQGIRRAIDSLASAS